MIDPFFCFVVFSNPRPRAVSETLASRCLVCSTWLYAGAAQARLDLAGAIWLLSPYSFDAIALGALSLSSISTLASPRSTTSSSDCSLSLS